MCILPLICAKINIHQLVLEYITIQFAHFKKNNGKLFKKGEYYEILYFYIRLQG